MLSKNCHMIYRLNIGQTSVKHQFKISVKHRLVSVCFYMRVICTVHLTVCSCHVTYVLKSKSTLYSCLNVKEFLARNRCKILYHFEHTNQYILAIFFIFYCLCIRIIYISKNFHNWVTVKILFLRL